MAAWGAKRMSVASSIVLPRLRLSSKKVISTQIYDFLRKLIIETTIKPGTLLSENGLSEHFHVSRQPVREALMCLSYEGLLSILPQRGSVVERISVSTLKQTTFVRTAIEKECILNYQKLDKRTRNQCLTQLDRLIAQQHQCDLKAAEFAAMAAEAANAPEVVPISELTDDDGDGVIDILETRAKRPSASSTVAWAEGVKDDVVADGSSSTVILREHRDLQDSNDKEIRATYFRLDDSFHEHICALSGGPMAWRTVQLIKGQMDRIRFLTFNHVTPTKNLTQEHSQILEYLKAEDFENCLKSLEAHLRTINESHKPVIREYGDWFTPESVAQLQEEDARLQKGANKS